MLKSEGHADLALPFTGPRIAGLPLMGELTPKSEEMVPPLTMGVVDLSPME